MRSLGTALAEKTESSIASVLYVVRVQYTHNEIKFHIFIRFNCWIYQNQKEAIFVYTSRLVKEIFCSKEIQNRVNQTPSIHTVIERGSKTTSDVLL